MGRLWGWVKKNWHWQVGAVGLGVLLGGVFAGRLSPGTALAIAGVGAGVLGYSAQVSRHQASLLQAGGALALAGVELRKGNRDAALKILEGAAGSILTTELTQYGVPKVVASDIPLTVGGSVTVHADTAAELHTHLHALHEAGWTEKAS